MKREKSSREEAFFESADSSHENSSSSRQNKKKNNNNNNRVLSWKSSLAISFVIFHFCYIANTIQYHGRNLDESISVEKRVLTHEIILQSDKTEELMITTTTTTTLSEQNNSAQLLEERATPFLTLPLSVKEGEQQILRIANSAASQEETKSSSSNSMHLRTNAIKGGKQSNQQDIQVVPQNIQENSPSRPSRIFWCGFENLAVWRHYLFPEYDSDDVKHIKYGYRIKDTQPDDIMVFGMHGRCGTKQNKIGHLYVEQHFQGKALFVNGEPFGSIYETRNQYDNDYNVVANRTTTTTNHLYQIGLLPTTDHSIRVYLVALSLSQRRKWHDLIFDPTKKPKSIHNTSRSDIVYMNYNCVPYREQAVATFSTVGFHIYHGTCQAKQYSWRNRTNFHKIPKGDPGAHEYNDDIYRHYKYCAVMENSYTPGYISEKILYAFAAGCIPIYYGTEEIFDIFNRKAFVYYNISQPQLALDQLQQLEENVSAYQNMQREPILANGDQTIEDYFSLTDDIGNATLKQRIRQMMGLE